MKKGILKATKTLDSEEIKSSPQQTYFLENKYHFLKRIEEHPTFSDKYYTPIIQQPSVPDTINTINMGKKSPRFIGKRIRPEALLKDENNSVNDMKRTKISFNDQIEIYRYQWNKGHFEISGKSASFEHKYEPTFDYQL